MHRLLPLGELTAPASPPIPNASWLQPGLAGDPGTPVAVADAAEARAAAVSRAGAKAARLAAARAAGFPVLPGWVLPAAESRPAIRAGATAVRGGGRPRPAGPRWAARPTRRWPGNCAPRCTRWAAG